LAKEEWSLAVEEFDIALEIVCTNLPAEGANSLHLGIQHDKAITEMASVASKKIVFRPVLRAQRNTDGSVNFLGPFAQGPKTERFIYLNWVTAPANQQTVMIGRIKLHLNHIAWKAVRNAVDTNRPLRVNLALTNAKGNPLMASVRPGVARWEFP
jgi:Family of unknown function (DUF5990)